MQIRSKKFREREFFCPKGRRRARSKGVKFNVYTPLLRARLPHFAPFLCKAWVQPFLLMRSKISSIINGIGFNKRFGFSREKAHSVPNRKGNNYMNIISMRFIVMVFSLAALVQVSNAQSDEKPKTGDQPPVFSTAPAGKDTSPVFSAVPADKGTTNAEAEKFRNSGIGFAVRLENDRAIAEFTKAIELDPKYADAYNRRGASYSNKKDDDRAVADFTKAIELNPKFDMAYINRGASYMVKKKYDLAIADFTKVIETGTEIEFAYIMRADAYEKIGRKDLAAADNKKFRELMNKPKP